MAFYSKEIQEKINSSIPLTELMERHGERLKRGTGKSVYFICPVCNGGWDNSRIHVSSNYFKCFKCDSQGSSFQGKPINYIQYKLNYSLTEAIEYLAKEYNLSISDSAANSGEFLDKQKVYSDVISFYSNYVDQTDYFMKRGISSEVVEKQKIGFAPGGTLKAYLLQKGYNQEKLKKYGLLNNKNLDSWFNRIIIPIYKNGYIVDFYTRRTDGEENLKHLYLEGQNLIIGHDEVDSKLSYINFVEAPISKLVAESHHFKNHIGLGGCTKWGMHLITFMKNKGIKKARIIFDNDENGEGQTQAYLFGKLLEENGIETKVVILPYKMDPADVLLNKGTDFYRNCLLNSIPYTKYRANFLMKDLELEDVSEHLYRRLKKWDSESPWKTFTSLFLS